MIKIALVTQDHRAPQLSFLERLDLGNAASERISQQAGYGITVLCPNFSGWKG